MLHFKNLQNFLAGSLTKCLPHRELVLEDNPKAPEIFRYVSEGIKLQDFFVSFCGTIKGLRYNSEVPPRISELLIMQRF